MNIIKSDKKITERGSMKTKLTGIAAYGAIAVIAAFAFGVVTYRLTTVIAGKSLVISYLLNISYIFLLLIADMILYAKMESKELTITKRNYKRYRFAYFDSFVSSKTTVYLFYIFVLIAGQLHYFNPSLLSGEFGDYLESIKYCLVIVMALDKLIEHISKDVKRLSKISQKFKKM
jgi:hypothetical protein